MTPDVLTRLRALPSIAAAQLWHHRRRVALAVAGVAVAVLLITLLAGLGGGVMNRGLNAIDNTNRDLWMSASVELSPGAVGGVENGLLDAHEVARQVDAREDVRNAQAVAFQSVYVAPSASGPAPPDADAFRTLVGMGVTGTSAPIPLKRGTGFDRGDVHYANGSYDGPMTRAVIVDERAADRLGVSVNDTIHLGGTIASARANEFRVVGVSSGISSFVGAPTVILHLGELQAISGTTESDAASFIAITVKDGVDHGDAAADIERDFQGYSVRTNREQLGQFLEGRAPVIVSTVAIVVLAVVIGMALVVNVAALLVYGQRAELAALKAAGVSGRLLVGTAGAQGVTIGLVGGGIGLAVTPVAAVAVNRTVLALTGIDSLIAMRPAFLLFGLGVAVAMGVAGATVAGYLIGRVNPLEHLH